MSTTSPRRPGTHTILIVDDTPANLGVVVESLEEQGFRVTIAQDGREGLQRAELVQPDLILLDVMMPGLDGFEVCRRLKARDGTRNIPVIFMTALADTDDKITGFRVGGVDYVTKPLQIDEVVARVNIHLKLRAMQQQLEAQNAQLQREILERRQVEEALEEERAFLQQVIDINPHLIFAKDRHGRFTLVNRALADAFHTTVEGILGKTDADILTTAREAESMHRDDLEVLQTLREKVIPEEAYTDPSGEVHLFSTIKRPILGKDGTACQILAVATDITARKLMEEQLHHLAYHESLTGLPNRVLFMDRLRQALAVARRHQHQVAVLLFDLDRFKNVNDTLGHEIGDRLLQELARRLTLHMRNSDTLCRFGGDEFLTMLPLVPPGGDVEAVAEKIRAAVAQPFRIDGHEISVGASIGIAIYPDHAGDGDTLLRYADIAMYEAKKSGGDRYGYYRAELAA